MSVENTLKLLDRANIYITYIVNLKVTFLISSLNLMTSYSNVRTSTFEVKCLYLKLLILGKTL